MRTRLLSPDFFRDDELGKLSAECRLLFAGLWVIADREGRLDDKPARIVADIFPYDTIDVNPLLEQLTNKPFIQRYSVDDKQYIQIVSWKLYQHPHKTERESKIPALTDV